MNDTTTTTTNMTQTAPEIDTPSISSSALLVELSIPTWSARKQDKKASEAVTQQHQAKRGSARVNKDLLHDAETLKAVQKFASESRAVHYSMTLPWSGSLAIIPTAQYFEYNNTMTGRQTEFYDLVQKFLDDYDWQLTQAQVSLGSLFVADEYPTVEQVRHKFGFHLHYFPVPEAGDFRVDLGNEAQQQLKEHYNSFYKNQMQDSMKHLWRQLYDALARMSERLDYSEGEKKKIFRDTLVENVVEVVDMLSSFNLTGDSQMEQMRLRLEEALRGVTADGLREDDYFRRETKRKVDEAIKNLPSLGV
ncbi:MAG TPA: DUF3150 domain-containing protein [Candidatus Paceibacterota bacterium]|nr:DUF3150 domain-containing protein [Candidatus Paceibacterota bacterium]